MPIFPSLFPVWEGSGKMEVSPSDWASITCCFSVHDRQTTKLIHQKLNSRQRKTAISGGFSCKYGLSDRIWICGIPFLGQVRYTRIFDSFWNCAWTLNSLRPRSSVFRSFSSWDGLNLDSVYKRCWLQVWPCESRIRWTTAFLQQLIRWLFQILRCCKQRIHLCDDSR